MPSLRSLAQARSGLGPVDVDWLQRLVADWQIVADLSFADLVLWLPDSDAGGYWAGAQVRPTTGPTALVDDVVGSFLPTGRRPLVDSALHAGRIAREGDPEWRDDVPVRVEAIPVRRGDRLLAVVARSTNLQGVRPPSRLELSYLQAASELSQMIAHGDFPLPGERSDRADTPRVGDGFVRLDPDGTVGYASPNALSVHRRLGLVGDLAGRSLVEVTRELVPVGMRPDEDVVTGVLGGSVGGDTELGNDQATVVARSIPLRPAGERAGALVLLRDVTELRRRERELVTKDATIREIHHRVKNNLQTVAALLRLQARRIDDGEGRAALHEAVRRVGAIAVVHETLSQTLDEEVDFDAVADRLTRLVVEVATTGRPVRTRRVGTFGAVGSDLATPLAMVFTELVQNAVEHGFRDDSGAGGPGTVSVRVRRDDEGVPVRAGGGPGSLRLEVVDDGVGLPPGFSLEASPSLGLSIARALLAELGGSLRLGDRGDAPGASAEVVVPLPPWRSRAQGAG